MQPDVCLKMSLTELSAHGAAVNLHQLLPDAKRIFSFVVCKRALIRLAAQQKREFRWYSNKRFAFLSCWQFVPFLILLPSLRTR